MIDPKGRLIPMVACIGNHEVDGGYGKTARGRPVLLRPVRRPVRRATLRHARLRRLPEPGAARHRPHRPDRRRADRLARQGAGRADRAAAPDRGQPRPGLPVVPPATRAQADKAGTGDANRKHWVPAVREAQRRRRAGAPRPHVQADPPLKDGLVNDNGDRLPGRRLVGPAARAEDAGETPLPGDHERVVPHDAAPPGRRAAVPRRDRGDRAHRRHLHDAEAPASRRRPERLSHIRQIRGGAAPCGNAA